MNLDNFNRHAVRRTVLKFYKRKEILTVNKIKEELRENISFNGSSELLHKIIFDIRFKYGKVDGQKFLIERTDVVDA